LNKDKGQKIVLTIIKLVFELQSINQSIFVKRHKSRANRMR